MNILMINGHVACLKTTLGYLLAPMLQLGHVTTSVLGDFVSDDTAPTFNSLREARYSAATSITRQFLLEGVPVILDGTFSRRAWREAIYRLADQFDVEDVISITCVCSDPAIIEQRLAYRRLASDAPDAAANHWGAYEGSIKNFESIEADRRPSGRQISRLVFDSASFLVRREEILTQYAESVALSIERLVAHGKLGRPQFGFGNVEESPCVLPANRLIALEGLGGSGKSSQAKRLTELLVRKGCRVYLLEEFSDGPVGCFLRERNAAFSDDHRLRVTQDPPSHTESLLVIGDSIARVRTACASLIQGLTPYDVIIADSYVWSYLAHGLALLPETAGAQLRQSMWIALSEIITPLRAVAEVQDTVYLRISAELAAKRIERRKGSRLSSESRRFLTRLLGIYEDVAKSSSAAVMDASLPLEGLAESILKRFSL